MLTELRLRDFRCFPAITLQLSRRVTFIIGSNAQGKTSLLEAACLLTRLQSPRTSSLGETIRFAQPFFALEGRLSETRMRLHYDGQKKRLELDGVAQTRSEDYLQLGRIAWFSNDDLELIRGGGSTRRRFLDFTCTQIDRTYLRHLRAYERALRSRNALLKEDRPRAEITAYNVPLLEHGTILLQTRATVSAALAPLIQQACADIGRSGETISAHYQPGATPDFATALEQSRSQEARLRQTVAGPHRDDLVLHLNDMPASGFASEGQQRTLALGLKLAQTRLIMNLTGRAPILLIDDVFGELDPKRRNNLLEQLPAESQMLITTTHLDWLESGAEAAILELSERQLTVKAGA